MSTPQEHIAGIREAKAARDSGNPNGQRVYQAQIYLFVDVHLEEIAAALAAPPATPAAQPADEREAFEAWCVKRWAGDRDGLTRNASGAYHLGPAEFAWSAWQARAALEGQG